MNLPQLAHISQGQTLPAWMTEEHFAKCVADTDLQKVWEPNDGDWCYRSSPDSIFQIHSVADYAAQGSSPDSSPSELGKDSHGRWDSDIFIASPEQLRTLGRA